MDQESRLIVFRAQTKNVKAINKAWRHLNRTINLAYINGDSTSVETHTKCLSLLYCAHAEATLSKIIHTPHGFTLDEIKQVKETGKSSVTDAWVKCVDLALRKIKGVKGSHKPNARKKIGSLIESFIYDPSVLRNKLAHGQWNVALNRKNSKVNEEITTKINSITVIDLYRFKEAFENLFRIVEDMIESPEKTHHRDYWAHISQFEETQAKMSGWTIESKIQSLMAKKERANINR